MNPTRARFVTIFGIKMKTFLILYNLDSNLSLFVESSMPHPSADHSLCRYLLALSEESRF